MMPVSVIILAAGSSSRMRQSKQLLPWKGKTLLTHAITTAMESRAGKVYVVLGKDKDLVKDLPVSIVVNDAWEKGIGSSIKAGLKAARNSEAVLFTTCDMPYVTTDHLNNIIKASGDIVASKYLDTIGVPALFRASMFEELSSIDDQEGARKIIEANKSKVTAIVLESGADLDTPEDYQKALSN